MELVAERLEDPDNAPADGPGRKFPGISLTIQSSDGTGRCSRLRQAKNQPSSARAYEERTSTDLIVNDKESTPATSVLATTSYHVPSYQQSHTQRSSGYGRGGSYYQDLGYGGSSDVD